MVDVDNVIQKADNYIKEMIRLMVSARLKQKNASEKVLKKLVEAVEHTRYTYRLGRLYEPLVRVERGGYTAKDLSKPTITLQYAGGYTTLYYDSNEIQIPEVPDWVIEPWTPSSPVINPLQASVDTLEDYFFRVSILRFPPDSDVEQSPNAENTFWKYYQFDSIAHEHSQQTLTFTSPPKLFWFTSVLEPQEFQQEYAIILSRTLTIAGVDYVLAARYMVGILKAKLITVDSGGTGEVTDVKMHAIYGRFTSETDKVDSLLYMGNPIPRGNLSDSLYIKEFIQILVAGHSYLITL